MKKVFKGKVISDEYCHWFLIPEKEPNVRIRVPPIFFGDDTENPPKGTVTITIQTEGK